MGRPVTQHLTPTQREGVAALYRETAAREAWLREHTAEVRFAVYMGDAHQAVGVMRRNAHEGKALLDVEAYGAWDEATAALRNAEHVYAREDRVMPSDDLREWYRVRDDISSLLVEARATFRNARNDDAAVAEAYRAEQYERNRGHVRFQVAGQRF